MSTSLLQYTSLWEEWMSNFLKHWIYKEAIIANKEETQAENSVSWKSVLEYFILPHKARHNINHATVTEPRDLYEHRLQYILLSYLVKFPTKKTERSTCKVNSDCSWQVGK